MAKKKNRGPPDTEEKILKVLLMTAPLLGLA